jgi:hypothetical protein
MPILPLRKRRLLPGWARYIHFADWSRRKGKTYNGGVIRREGGSTGEDDRLDLFEMDYGVARDFRTRADTISRGSSMLYYFTYRQNSEQTQ